MKEKPETIFPPVEEKSLDGREIGIIGKLGG